MSLLNYTCISKETFWHIYSYPSHKIRQKSPLVFVKVRSRDVIDYFHLQDVDTSNCMYSIIRSSMIASRHPRQDEKSVSLSIVWRF